MQAISTSVLLIPGILLPLAVLILGVLLYRMNGSYEKALVNLEGMFQQANALRQQVDATTTEDKFNLALWRKNASTGVLVYANQRARMTIFTPVGVNDPLGVRMEDLPFNPEALKTLKRLDEEAKENPESGMLGLIQFHPQNDWHLVLKNYTYSNAGEALIQGVAFKPQNLPADPNRLTQLLGELNQDHTHSELGRLSQTCLLN
jgi:hypothetical protein